MLSKRSCYRSQLTKTRTMKSRNSDDIDDYDNVSYGDDVNVSDDNNHDISVA